MGIKSFFTKSIPTAAKWIFNKIKETVKENEQQILDDLKAIAVPIIESVAQIDIDGNGRISAATEIVEIAAKIGGDFGKKILWKTKQEVLNDYAYHTNEANLKRTLALCRLALNLAQRAAILPKNKVLNGIIEVVTNEVLD